MYHGIDDGNYYCTKCNDSQNGYIYCQNCTIFSKPTEEKCSVCDEEF